MVAIFKIYARGLAEANDLAPSKRSRVGQHRKKGRNDSQRMLQLRNARNAKGQHDRSQVEYKEGEKEKREQKQDNTKRGSQEGRERVEALITELLKCLQAILSPRCKMEHRHFVRSLLVHSLVGFRYLRQCLILLLEAMFHASFVFSSLVFPGYPTSMPNGSNYFEAAGRFRTSRCRDSTRVYENRESGVLKMEEQYFTVLQFSSNNYRVIEHL